jgi:hypothetical protein
VSGYFPPFYTIGNKCTERFSNFFKITEEMADYKRVCTLDHFTSDFLKGRLAFNIRHL